MRGANVSSLVCCAHNGNYHCRYMSVLLQPPFYYVVPRWLNKDRMWLKCIRNICLTGAELHLHPSIVNSLQLPWRFFPLLTFFPPLTCCWCFHHPLASAKNTLLILTNCMKPQCHVWRPLCPWWKRDPCWRLSAITNNKPGFGLLHLQIYHFAVL